MYRLDFCNSIPIFQTVLKNDSRCLYVLLSFSIIQVIVFDMNCPILPPTDDWIFKLLFGDERNANLLIAMLQTFIELPDEEYELTFLDTHLKPEYEEDKFGILDVKVKTKSGKIINIEIQVNPVKNIGRRLSYYKSKMIVEQINKGDKYQVIQQVICICITDYTLFPQTSDYLNNFVFFNSKNGLRFYDIPEEIYTLELPKVPVQNDGSAIWAWMQFLRSKEKEEFEMAAAKNPAVREAVNTLYELSTDKKVRAEYEMRHKAWLDRQSQLYDSREEGRAEGRAEAAIDFEKKMKDIGLSSEQISMIIDKK